jgi:hypothetical protein
MTRIDDRDATRPVRWAIAALILFGVVFVAAGLGGWGSPAANEQAVGMVSRWCERVSNGLLREPVNTLGNLGFVAAGLTMFSMLARDVITLRPPANRFIGNTPVAMLYASASVFLGPGSMVMHGTHTRFGAWLDNLSMVAYILIPWLLNLSVMGGWKRPTFFWWYGAFLAGYGLGYWFIGPDLGIGLDLFGVSIGLWIISEVLLRWWSPFMRTASGLVGFAVAAVFGITPSEMLGSPGAHWWVLLFWIPGLVGRRPADIRRRYWPWFWIGTAAFVLAYRIWLDGTGDSPGCRPDSLIQAHAIWHLLSAVATLAFFFFLRTERRRETATVG